MNFPKPKNQNQPFSPYRRRTSLTEMAKRADHPLETKGCVGENSYLSKAGSAVNNIMNQMRQNLTGFSGKECSKEEPNITELTEYLVNDKKLWDQFKQTLIDSNVVTHMATRELLLQFIAKNMNDINIKNDDDPDDITSEGVAPTKLQRILSCSTGLTRESFKINKLHDSDPLFSRSNSLGHGTTSSVDVSSFFSKNAPWLNRFYEHQDEHDHIRQNKCMNKMGLEENEIKNVPSWGEFANVVEQRCLSWKLATDDFYSHKSAYSTKRDYSFILSDRGEGITSTFSTAQY